jgi:lysophospholipase L1-like esterase
MKAKTSLRLVILGLLICMVSQPVVAEQSGSQRWEREIQAFERADQAIPPRQGAIVFVGSSTIRMWTTLAQDFPEYKVLNRGFGGCQIADCTYYADRIVIPYHPRLIVLRAGGNDINAGKTPEGVRDDFQAFVAKVRAKLPKVRIAYMTINATPSRWKNVEREKKANQLIKDCIAKGVNLDYIDTFDATMGADGKPRVELFVEDHLHFNAEGYKILVARVRKYLTRAAPSPTAPGASKPIAVGRTGARQVLARFLGRRALAVGPSSLMVRPSQIPPRIRTGGDADPTNDPPARLRPLPSGLFIAGDRIEKLLAFQPRLPCPAQRCSHRASVDTGRTGATAAGFDRRAQG